MNNNDGADTKNDIFCKMKVEMTRSHKNEEEKLKMKKGLYANNPF